MEREALCSFVDACQVLVGRIDTNADQSAALVREILLRCCGARRTSRRPLIDQLQVCRGPCTSSKSGLPTSIDLASVAKAVDVTPFASGSVAQGAHRLTFLQQLRRSGCATPTSLLTTAASIKEIAYACGYTNLASFGRDSQRAHMARRRASGGRTGRWSPRNPPEPCVADLKSRRDS
jgi:AraC-like DNA-binding protein